MIWFVSIKKGASASGSTFFYGNKPNKKENED
jgi:hypothetical protein